MLFYDLFRHEPKLVRIKAGDYLFRAGDLGDVMYVLISGTAQILVDERVREEVTPGGVLGEAALADQVCRSESVLATSDCELACINRKRFYFLISQAPQFATEVMRTMACRLREADSLLEC